MPDDIDPATVDLDEVIQKTNRPVQSSIDPATVDLNSVMQSTNHAVGLVTGSQEDALKQSGYKPPVVQARPVDWGGLAKATGNAALGTLTGGIGTAIQYGMGQSPIGDAVEDVGNAIDNVPLVHPAASAATTLLDTGARGVRTARATMPTTFWKDPNEKASGPVDFALGMSLPNIAANMGRNVLQGHLPFGGDGKAVFPDLASAGRNMFVTPDQAPSPADLKHQFFGPDLGQHSGFYNAQGEPDFGEHKLAALAKMGLAGMTAGASLAVPQLRPHVDDFGEFGRDVADVAGDVAMGVTHDPLMLLHPGPTPVGKMLQAAKFDAFVEGSASAEAKAAADAALFAKTGVHLPETVGAEGAGAAAQATKDFLQPTLQQRIAAGQWGLTVKLPAGSGEGFGIPVPRSLAILAAPIDALKVAMNETKLGRVLFEADLKSPTGALFNASGNTGRYIARDAQAMLNKIDVEARTGPGALTDDHMPVLDKLHEATTKSNGMLQLKSGEELAAGIERAFGKGTFQRSVNPTMLDGVKEIDPEIADKVQGAQQAGAEHFSKQVADALDTVNTWDAQTRAKTWDYLNKLHDVPEKLRAIWTANKAPDPLLAKAIVERPGQIQDQLAALKDQRADVEVQLAKSGRGTTPDWALQPGERPDVAPELQAIDRQMAELANEYPQAVMRKNAVPTYRPGQVTPEARAAMKEGDTSLGNVTRGGKQEIGAARTKYHGMGGSFEDPRLAGDPDAPAGSAASKDVPFTVAEAEGMSQTGGGGRSTAGRMLQKKTMTPDGLAAMKDDATTFVPNTLDAFRKQVAHEGVNGLTAADAEGRVLNMYNTIPTKAWQKLSDMATQWVKDGEDGLTVGTAAERAAGISRPATMDELQNLFDEVAPGKGKFTNYLDANEVKLAQDGKTTLADLFAGNKPPLNMKEAMLQGENVFLHERIANELADFKALGTDPLKFKSFMERVAPTYTYVAGKLRQSQTYLGPQMPAFQMRRMLHDFTRAGFSGGLDFTTGMDMARLWGDYEKFIATGGDHSVFAGKTYDMGHLGQMDGEQFMRLADKHGILGGGDYAQDFGRLYGNKPTLALKAETATPEHIVASAWKNPEGEIFTGLNHAEAMQKGGVDFGNGVRPEDTGNGYLTNEGRWVSREDAADLNASYKEWKRGIAPTPKQEGFGIKALDSEQLRATDGSYPAEYTGEKPDVSVPDDAEIMDGGASKWDNAKALMAKVHQSQMVLESAQRASVFGTFIRKGMSPTQAEYATNEALFNMRNLSPTAKLLRDSGVADFAVWKSKSIPWQVKTMFENPGLFMAVHRMMDDVSGGDIPASQLPDQARDKYNAIVSRDAKGKLQVYTDSSGNVPFSEAMNMQNAFLNGRAWPWMIDQFTHIPKMLFDAEKRRDEPDAKESTGDKVDRYAEDLLGKPYSTAKKIVNMGTTDRNGQLEDPVTTAAKIALVPFHTSELDPQRQAGISTASASKLLDSAVYRRAAARKVLEAATETLRQKYVALNYNQAVTGDERELAGPTREFNAAQAEVDRAKAAVIQNAQEVRAAKALADRMKVAP